MDYGDTLGAHVDAVTEGVRAFTLAMDKDAWTATATRKHARNGVEASGATPIEAVANLLAAMRDEPEEPQEAGLEAPDEPAPESAEPTSPDEPSLQG